MRAITFALLAGLALPALAAERAVYLVEFERPALSEFRGDPGRGLKATLTAHGVDLDSKAAQDYLKHLAEGELRFLSAAGERLQRAPQLRASYRLVYSGVALELSASEADALRDLPGVRSIQPEPIYTLDSDAGPGFVGAPVVWAGSAGQPPTRGENVVVGVIDSGINPEHPAFAEVDASGYRHQSPRPQPLGLCASTPRCNGKLIGIYDFTTESPRDGIDQDGHGSHVAAIAVGNLRTARIGTQTTQIELSLSGVAPRAHLISYKACLRSVNGQPGQCPGSATLQALERALADGVAVINYSIGGTPSSPWASLTGGDSNMRAMFNLMQAGVAVAVSAGNSGPTASTIRSPANAPWVLASANISHDRRILNQLVALSGGTPPFAVADGAGLTGSYGPARLVLGESQGSALCSRGEDSDFPPSGVSNPWSGRVFNGEIVICDRGVQARVAKSNNVRLAGGGGMVLVNAASDGESVVSDDHSLPSTHLGFAAGTALKNWVRNTPNASGRLAGAQAVRNPAYGDILSASSSRGPDLTGAGVLKPNLAAPGSSIIAAAGTGSGEATLSGTSMASPHTAGALALLRARRPNDSVGALYSALELTAESGLRGADGSTPASSLDVGAGRLRVDRAMATGLVLPLSAADFSREDPRFGGDPRRLNLASLYDRQCRSRCSFTRVVEGWREATWSVQAPSTGPIRISVTPANFRLLPGERRTLSIEVDVSDPSALGRELDARITLTPDRADMPPLNFTVAVRSDIGDLPAIDIATDRDRGVHDTSFAAAIDFPVLSYQLHGPVPASVLNGTLLPDSTPTEVFDSEAGTRTIFVDGSGAGTWRAEVSAGGGRDFDLFLGRDDNNNGVAEFNELRCRADSPSSAETCQMSGTGGRFWVRVQNTAPGSSADAFELRYAYVPDSGPANPAGYAHGNSSAASGAPVSFRIGYDIGGLREGERAFAALELRAGTSANQAFARLPVTIRRSFESAPGPDVLSIGAPKRFLLPAQGQQNRLVLDVPTSVGGLQLRIRSVHGPIEAYVARASGNNIPFEVPPAPAESEALWRSPAAGQDFSLTLTGANLGGARLYVVTRNGGTQGTAVEITGEWSGASAAQPFAYEHYYNPARSGHGLFFTRGGGSAQMAWYTYDEGGQSTWLMAFLDRAALESNRPVRADLARFSWAGETALPVRVGQVTLTPQNGRMVFAWEWQGRSGSEPMQLLAAGTCTNLTGRGIADASGNWYQPNRSGWGANWITRPELDFLVLYLYDGRGAPRWVAGQNAGYNASMSLLQARGFCPWCASFNIQGQPVGSLSRNFDAAAQTLPGFGLSGTWTLNTSFIDGVPGSWVASSSRMALLTELRGCP